MKKPLLLFLSLAFASLAIAQGWQWQNPLPQGNDLQCVRFVDAGTGYAVGATGTILKTVNAGVSWEVLSSGTSTVLNSVFFTDAAHGYAVGGSTLDHAVLKTDDGGASWIKLSVGTGGLYLNSVYFINADTGWIVGRGDAYPAVRLMLKTTDGGMTWTDQAAGAAGSLSSIMFVNEEVGYAVGNALLKTTDGGVTWNGSAASGNAVFFADQNTGYIAGQYGRIQKTTNGGVTWTLVNADSAYSLSSVYFTDAVTGFAVGGNWWTNGVILKTANGGASWTSLALPGMNHLFSVYFTDPNTGYALGRDGQILKTADAGTTWSYLSSSATSNTINDICFPGTGTGCAVGDGGTILTTTNGGTTWTPRNSGSAMSLHSVCFTSVNTGYAVGDSGTILKTTNGGTDWVSQTSGTELNLASVHFPSADTGYAAGGGVLPGAQKVVPVMVRTTDGGSLWTIIYQDTTEFYKLVNSVFFTDANRGFATGIYWMGGFLMKTTNGGADWTEIMGGPLSSVFFPDDSTGYMLSRDEMPSNSNDLLRTTDGGLTWESNWFSGFVATSLHFVSADTGYAVGWEGNYGNGAVVRTTNGGLTWTAPLLVTSNDLNAVWFTDEETGYVAGTNGAILKTGNGGGFPVGEDRRRPPAVTLKIYPNPASEKITVETPGIRPGAMIVVTDLAGRNLLKRTIAGSQAMIDISSLARGIYIVKLVSEGSLRTVKVIKD